MLKAILLGLLACPSAPTALSEPSFGIQDDAALRAKITAAGTDVAKLLELAAACLQGGQERDAETVYKRVLELDAGNETARKGLRHQFYGGKWFESFSELAKYKRDEDAQMKGKGLARWKDGWVPEGDVPFLAMEWKQNEKGLWVHPFEAAREQQVAQWKAAGHQFRADDNSWIAPADFDKWQALQWKCGDEWVDTAKANQYHAQIERPWELAGEHYVVWSTCDWDGANLARWHADQTYYELVRIFGSEPRTQPYVFVLNSLAQYNQAAGNQGTLNESEGISSLHGAYFADCTFDFVAKPPRHIGCGVCYWDRADPVMSGWGACWVRWAAAQSFLDAIDPSWTAVSAWIAKQGRDDIESFKGPFWGEKRLPRWLRYGAAAYVERFMRNPLSAEGADPWDLRTFAFAELKKSGGLRKLDDVFAFKLDTADIPASSRLYQEAGVLVAYLLDGAAGDKELTTTHQAFRQALKSGSRDDVAAASAALQKALAKHEGDIKKFAGL